MENFFLALILKFVIVIALFLFARILAMAIIKILPNGNLKKWLLKKAPD